MECSIGLYFVHIKVDIWVHTIHAQVPE